MWYNISKVDSNLAVCFILCCCREGANEMFVPFSFFKGNQRN